MTYRTEPALTLATLCPLELFPRGATFTALGTVHDLRRDRAGNTDATLRLSVGDLPIVARPDTLPPDIANGSSARIKMRRRHRDDGQGVCVLSAIPSPREPDETSWCPTALYHRHAGMLQLRRLLSTLEPALQGLFMSSMVDAQVQRRFFWRVGAGDHYCYPGGLFDMSVAAARVASQGAYASERERGLATLASLLFDIGKVFEERLEPDWVRLLPGLQPHAQTARRLQGPLLRVARMHPQLANDLAQLLGCHEVASAEPNLRLVPLRKQVRNAVQKAWESTKADPKTRANRGEAA